VTIRFPRARHVEALEPYRLRIHWTTGETLTVDLADKLRGLPALRDPALFVKVRAGEQGLSIEWLDNELGADNVYAWSREQRGEISHEMLFAWMHRNGLTVATAAKALGLSQRMLAYYRSGTRPIPRHIWLACKGWEAERRERVA
jgi:hypothetical protein